MNITFDYIYKIGKYILGWDESTFLYIVLSIPEMINNVILYKEWSKDLYVAKKYGLYYFAKMGGNNPAFYLIKEYPIEQYALFVKNKEENDWHWEEEIVQVFHNKWWVKEKIKRLDLFNSLDWKPIDNVFTYEELINFLKELQDKY